MKGKKLLLVILVFLCLSPTNSVRLSAQQQGLARNEQVPVSPSTPKQTSSPKSQDQARGCREFLASANELRSRFAAATDTELGATEKRAKGCIELPSVRIRQAAFDAYAFMRDEEENRELRHASDSYWSMVEHNNKVIASMIESEVEQDQKQRADFAEVANFAAALYKEKELYLDGEVKCSRAYMDLQDRYSATYNLAQDAIHIAEKSLNRSAGLSLPVFLNAPAPQVIRVETPSVPRSLHCTTNSTPNPSLSPLLSTSTAWTDCHW
jgi:hypothetical protein